MPGISPNSASYLWSRFCREREYFGVLEIYTLPCKSSWKRPVRQPSLFPPRESYLSSAKRFHRLERPNVVLLQARLCPRRPVARSKPTRAQQLIGQRSINFIKKFNAGRRRGTPGADAANVQKKRPKRPASRSRSASSRSWVTDPRQRFRSVGASFPRESRT